MYDIDDYLRVKPEPKYKFKLSMPSLSKSETYDYHHWIEEIRQKVKKNFPECITVNLVSMGLEPTASNLSKVTGITKATCRRYLSGNCIPKKEYMLRVFDALNYPIEGFIAMLHLKFSVKDFFSLLNSCVKPNLLER